jgi:hypothetical protein
MLRPFFTPERNKSTELTMHATQPLADSTGTATTFANDLAEEKHYTPQEIAALWSLSTNTIRRMFRDEVGVVEFGSDETRWSRKRKTLRIPETVLRRVHQRLRCRG